MGIHALPQMARINFKPGMQCSLGLMPNEPIRLDIGDPGMIICFRLIWSITNILLTSCP